MGRVRIMVHAQYRKLVEAERVARDRLRASEHESNELRRSRSREWFRSVYELLDLYVTASADVKLADTPLRLPIELVQVFSKTAESLAVGACPLFIEDAVSRGRTGLVPTERRDIEYAVAYVTAARAKLISDDTPIKTISSWFGVTARAVHGWAKKHQVPDPAKKVHGYIEVLPKRAEEAGQRYKIAGRSTKAISARGPRLV